MVLKNASFECFFMLLTLFLNSLYLFQSSVCLVLVALCFTLSRCRDVFLISELYHGLSFGRIVTILVGIHVFARLRNFVINKDVALSIFPV